MYDFGWYAHLKEGQTKLWLLMASLSWSIAFVEYLLQSLCQSNWLSSV
ncbi:DMT family protein [Deefgea rivuli]|nr:DMT family protein [Deefgea rivuli]